ncbi:MAG TPA: flagellar hook capping FlgD N-terminal domain-containing protein [Steroidobacteraceae bacterium]|nr:flagellar hook capping FlgD N-terminal domain-containing protein [Steroidobacteraceae bacterium]
MPIDMDIVNAAMVRQRTPEEAANVRAANEAKKTELGQDDFLQLMMTQLKNQDPFKPLDPSQYVGQLAQFSSVAGLKEINTAIAGLTDSLRGNRVLDGAAMIGRTVVAEGSQVYLEAPSEDRIGIAGAITVPKGTTSLQLVVKDASGATIKTEALSATSGMHGFQWDGTNDAGTAVAAGSYKVELMANVAGKTESLQTSIAANVSSVALDPTTGALLLDTDTLGEISMSDVERVL